MENNPDFNKGYTSGRIEFAAELVRNKIMTIEYASNKLNISTEALESLIKSLDNPDDVSKSRTILVPIGGRPTKYTARITEELSQKYKTMTIKELSELYGVSTRTMIRWLKQAGLTKNIKKEGEKI